MEQLVQIGNIINAHGVKGIMKMKITPAYWEDIQYMKAVFIYGANNELIPYFIEHIEATMDDIFLIKLEGIDGKEQATQFQKAAVYARSEDISVEVIEEENIVGYTLIDKTSGAICSIIEIVEMPHQDLAKVIYEGREVLIPLHEDLIEELDDKSKQLIMILPEEYFKIF